MLNQHCVKYLMFLVLVYCFMMLHSLKYTREIIMLVK